MFKKRYRKLLIMGYVCLFITIATTVCIIEPFTGGQMLIIVMAGLSSTLLYISSYVNAVGKPLRIEDLAERTPYMVIAESCANTVLIASMVNRTKPDSRFLRVSNPTRFKCDTVFVVIEKLSTEDIDNFQLTADCFFKEGDYFIKTEVNKV